MQPENLNKLYEKAGVKPPTQEVHGTEEEIREQLKEQAQKKHEWRQYGQFLHCISCENGHGRSIGIDQMLVGTQNGVPILKKIDV